MLACLRNVVILTICVAVFVYLVNIWLANKKYIFSEEAIIKIGKKYQEPTVDMKKVIESIHKDFKAMYPDHILPKDDVQFVFFNAGGWLGAIYMMHASLTEFVLVYGTTMDTSGHSGRYWVNRTDIILSGEMLEWKEGEVKSKVHKPGSVVKYAWGEASAVTYKANMWKLSYGRGFIPSALPYVTSSYIFGNHDYLSLYNMFKIHVKSFWQEFVYCITHINELF
ncbi:hypothetical protein HELRODRAFT_77677 [Helobdella robusta]|uniref:Sigma non-opioid intracellular receptor 1 n=1 Tax=Helobdella robusta TaxID=6412 RepID=T1G322_HELRO|nr:hypothetical protein HELRODRAFT_77677 [Helobdella robusta]ESO05163.1 hypothetical protein HELRODRAFT_77677 [Helobdella robusta]